MTSYATNTKKKQIKCACCGQEHSDLTFHLHHENICELGSHEYEQWENTDSVASELRTFSDDDLLNMAKERQEASHETADRVKDLRVGDPVKLCFLIKDKTGSWLPEKLRHSLKHTKSEAMFVKITSIDGKWPDLRLQGVLLNMPLLIHSSELTLGSKVHFSPDYVHSICASVSHRS
jgi:hypothetical protein